VIYQNIKERVNELLEKKEQFYKFRDLIFNKLLEKLKSSPPMVIERILFTISILMSIGIISFWPECVEDLLIFAKISKQNCYFALMILENINKELFDLSISAKTMLRIKDMMIFKSPLIQEFIFLVLTSVANEQASKDELKFNNQLFNQTLMLTHSWIKFGLNVLKIPLLSQTLINYLNEDNIKYISEIFSDSISYSENSKYYSVNEVYDVDSIFAKFDKQEFQSLENLVQMIKNFLMNVSKDSDEHFTILNGLANIFQSFTENFINLLFMKNPFSQNLLELFFYFSGHKNRKISFKFIESVNEMREFINRGYKFYNYNDEEKIQFLNYLIKISENVMTNCKPKSLKLDIGSFSKKETLEFQDLEKVQIDEEADNIQDEEENLSVQEYRKGAEDYFYNIFLIFTHNFHEEGAEYFFRWLMGILNDLNVNEDSIASDENRLIIIHVILLVVKSILDTFDVTGISDKYILNFCSFLITSKIFGNEKMIIEFLVFLDQASSFIGRDNYLLNNTVQFLINVGKIKLLENISSYILLSISDFLKFPSTHSFGLVYEFYKTNYDSFSPQTLSYLCESLCGFVSVMDKEQKSLINITEDEVISYFALVTQPATERIHRDYTILRNYVSGESNSNVNQISLDFNKIKLDFLRNYSVLHNTLKKSFFLSRNILKNMFLIYMKEISEVTLFVFEYFVKDTIFIKELTKTYSKLLYYLEGDGVQYFDYFNNLILNAYLNNYENYTLLQILKVLYSETAKYSNEKKQYCSTNFIKLCDIINKNVYLMKKNHIELIDLYAQLFIKVLENVDYLIINEDVVQNMISLFIDAIKTIAEPSMNKSVLKSFTKIVGDRNFIPVEILEKKFYQIVYEVYSAADHYESVSVNEVNIIGL
jgi:hypothetical protein